MIVGGLMAELVMSILLLPTLCVWFAGEDQRTTQTAEEIAEWSRMTLLPAAT